MQIKKNWIATAMFLTCSLTMQAQEEVPADTLGTADDPVVADTLVVADSLVMADSLMSDTLKSILLTDSVAPVKVRKDWSSWRPDPQRALWLALSFQEADRSTTANTGSSHWYTADSSAVCTP